MAFHQRRPTTGFTTPITARQYAAFAFGARCTGLGVRPSRGTVGDCYDNAMAESFFATL